MPKPLDFILFKSNDAAPMVHLYPLPDPKGLDKTKAFYLNRFGKTLTDEEAYDVLFSVMRFLYLQTLPPDVLPQEPEQPSSGEAAH